MVMGGFILHAGLVGPRPQSYNDGHTLMECVWFGIDCVQLAEQHMAGPLVDLVQVTFRGWPRQHLSAVRDCFDTLSAVFCAWEHLSPL